MISDLQHFSVRAKKDSNKYKGQESERLGDSEHTKRELDSESRKGNVKGKRQPRPILTSKFNTKRELILNFLLSSVFVL